MNDVTFVSWRRRAGSKIGAAPEAGRPVSQLVVKADDTSGGHAEATVPFALHGPGDVSGLMPGAIVSRYPRPGQTDAETDYCPYVELAVSDLPWRYSPVGADAAGMRPWLALLVLQPAEILARQGGSVRVSAAALAAHDVGDVSAHVQRDSGHEVGRVLAQRTLSIDRDYRAFLVPRYDHDGAPRWDGGQDRTIPVYDEWAFHTAEAGKFETLAEQLHPADQLADFGRINVSVGDAADERVNVRGALTGILDTMDPPPPAAAASRLATLLEFDPDAGVPGHVAGFDTDGRRYVRPPTYGEAWQADASVGAPPAGWVDQLATDPTHRVVAGLGLQAGIDLQDEITEAAGDRFGAAAAANQRIAGLVAGLAVSKSLWDRRLPLDRDGRLRLLGLAAGRILAKGDDGATRPLLDHATGPGRTLPAGLFSTAALRILRPGAARLRHALPGATNLIEVANKPRPTVRRPDDAPGDPRHSDGAASGDALVAFVRSDTGGLLIGQADVATGDDLGPALVQANVDMTPEFRAALGRLGRFGAEVERAVPRPADLGALDDALVRAFDPHNDPVAVRRVRATIKPDDVQPLAPREPCPDLDLPAWRYLRDAKREWLLPGASTLADGEVVGLASNPVFADAFLVGWNTQALGELRWRDLRPATGCTPLRRFWDRSATAPGGAYGADTDIVGIAEWVLHPGEIADRRAAPLGDASHTPSGESGRHLVVAFHTDLFRRYPSTLVYLAKPAPPADPTAVTLQNRILPAFVAQITPKLVLFAFAVPPEALEEHWVAVEQQPPGIRFDRTQDPHGGKTSAERSAAMLVRPVRVLLAGTALVSGGD